MPVVIVDVFGSRSNFGTVEIAPALELSLKTMNTTLARALGRMTYSSPSSSM